MDFEKYCRENCVERKGTGTLKWDSLEEIFGDADLLPMWVADMEIRCPQSVLDAMAKRVSHGVFGYGKVEDSYYEAFFAWQKKHHNMDIAKENVRFATGVVGSLYAAVRAYTKEEESVIICSPVYYPFYDAVLNSGRKLVTVELDNNDGYYTLDYEKFEKEIEDNDVKLFILCSPHNPVCRVWTEEELEKIFDICRRHGVLVVSDEIHHDFVFQDAEHIPMGLIKKEKTVVLSSASKTFNLTGMTTALAIIPDEQLRAKWDEFSTMIHISEGNSFGYLAGEAAFLHGQEWLEELKKIIYGNYLELKNRLLEALPKIQIAPLEGTYLMWVDFGAYLKEEELEQFFEKRCKIALDYGNWFHGGAQTWVRFNLATSRELIDKAAEAMISALTE